MIQRRIVECQKKAQRIERSPRRIERIQWHILILRLTTGFLFARTAGQARRASPVRAGGRARRSAEPAWYGQAGGPEGLPKQARYCGQAGGPKGWRAERSAKPAWYCGQAGAVGRRSAEAGGTAGRRAGRKVCQAGLVLRAGGRAGRSAEAGPVLRQARAVRSAKPAWYCGLADRRAGRNVCRGRPGTAGRRAGHKVCQAGLSAGWRAGGPESGQISPVLRAGGRFRKWSARPAVCGQANLPERSPKEGLVLRAGKQRAGRRSPSRPGTAGRLGGRVRKVCPKQARLLQAGGRAGRKGLPSQPGTAWQAGGPEGLPKQAPLLRQGGRGWAERSAKPPGGRAERSAKPAGTAGEEAGGCRNGLQKQGPGTTRAGLRAGPDVCQAGPGTAAAGRAEGLPNLRPGNYRAGGRAERFCQAGLVLAGRRGGNRNGLPKAPARYFGQAGGPGPKGICQAGRPGGTAGALAAGGTGRYAESGLVLRVQRAGFRKVCQAGLVLRLAGGRAGRSAEAGPDGNCGQAGGGWGGAKV
ncbi:collagen alpha-2(I) chain-like [Macrobrachium nipponense]|uniref:collagen alpha-2(I) chain-like n=1 Tax=Macrobrachium nipponense TaxID=159736 RepID=UPI0030C7F53B